MAWWAWIMLGFVLTLAELLTPGGFYLIFFGIGALVVGLVDLIGMQLSPWVQWFLFSILSVACVVFLRRPLVDRLSARGSGSTTPTVDTDKLVGEVAIAAESIAAGGMGRVDMRGAAWKACNRGAQVLNPGQRCVVERIEGLTLDVHAQ